MRSFSIMQRANLGARLGAGTSWSSRLGWSTVSLLGFLAFWEILALIIQHRHLPTPTVVATAMMHELVNGDLGYHVGITLLRVAAAFVIAMFIGSAIGILLGRFKRPTISSTRG
jgi:NitT/TauT family transport system permease protein